MVFIEQPRTVSKSNSGAKEDGRPSSNITRLRGRQIFFKERSRPLLKLLLQFSVFITVIIGGAVFALVSQTDQPLISASLEVFRGLADRLID